MRKIVFFLETNKPLNEDQLIFLNLAKYLADNSDRKVFYVNNFFKDDSVRISSSGLRYSTPDTFDYSLSNDAVFFTPVNYLMHLLVRIKDYPYAKICLYQYSSQAVNWLCNNMFNTCSSKTMDEFLNGYISRSYMDYGCVGQYDCNVNISDKFYLPGVLSEKIADDYSAENLIDNGRLNIGYLGALNSEAICSLYNLFSNLALSQNDKKTDIHIIGKAKISLNSGFKKSSTNLTRVIFTGDIDKESRKNYVKKNVDILIASRVNAVEGATYGVPVIVPVCDNKPFTGNNYVYLFDTKGYRYLLDYMGLVASTSKSYKIDKVLSDVYDSGEKTILAEACYKYCLENNTLEAVADKFISLINNCDLNVKDCLCEQYFMNSLKQYDDYMKANGHKNYTEYLQAKKAAQKK